MRTYDNIITQIIAFCLILGSLWLVIFLIELNQLIVNVLILSSFLVLILALLFIFSRIYSLRKERSLIHTKLDGLQSMGLRVYRKQFERLLYSRDVADLPKLGKFLYNFNVLAVLQPNDIKQLKGIIQLCEEFSVPFIPRGAGTGGYGGVLPTKNGFIVILTQIKDIILFDPETNIVEVEAGVTWGRLREFLIPRGFDLFTYPSSAPSSSVGGWIASGGYGIGSTRFGSINQSLHSITLVGTDGKEFVIDKPSDFVGNFGTLGVIWKISLKIRTIQPMHHVAVTPKSHEAVFDHYKDLEMRNPYYLRYIDPASLVWIKKDNKMGSVYRNASFGIISASFLEEDWIKSQEKLENLSKSLPDKITIELWNDRFHTLRLKRKGPSLIISEVIVPSNALDEFLMLLSKWFATDKYSIEIISVNNQTSMVMVWFPTDQRKRNLPIIGSIPYLIHWYRSFQVIRLAWSIGGSTYNSGGLWLSPYPNESYKVQLENIHNMKRKTDPKGIFNPGKIESSRIPRFFPIIPWALFLKIGLPIASILYRIIPKKYR